jgi:SAM-dependent methyltransferase
MDEQNAWHSKDRFWQTFEPILFNEQRQSNARVEFDHVLRLLNVQLAEGILDLYCGTGRHSLEAARQGYSVVGVDRTESFIKKAKQKASDERLEVGFIVADMKEFCRPNSFDIVINLFGSFGYFEDPEDDRQVVRNMHASLRPGGRILIETMGKEIAAREFKERDWSEHGSTLFLAEREPIEDWSRIKTRWIIVDGDKRIEHTVTVRSYSAADLTSLLVKSGFGNCKAYGNLEGRAYDHESERLVVVGTK